MMNYNKHDFDKLATYMEQTDENGVKNGEKLSDNYDPNDPETWGSYWVGDRFKWRIINGEKRIQEISVNGKNQCGSMDVSGCTALVKLDCSFNNLSELDVSGCTALKYLPCYDNNLSELDVSHNTALEELDCSSNNLTELDVSNNTALKCLYCYDNNLSELDVSHNTALEELDCSNRCIIKLQ